ncbi:DUF2993 domain-containing protein [Agromyces badenianii]|uniref:LmeA family phospholipid-binding protein n=1 Tax=Agromyces badenianii TaxID=2080742 RepID=UPI000D60555B|nr:DUF2993 domain-containing protein [Agromyces badenianii]PWC03127.1 DUF2993 domain-containing protein [Agromyces badenianii]
MPEYEASEAPKSLADAQPTEVIPPVAGRTASSTRWPLRRAAQIWIVVVAVLLALVALAVVADVVARNVAEQQVAEAIEANLPAGVEGDVEVTIGGFSAIAQYLTGTMQRVELDAPQLSVDGAPIDVSVVAEGLPVDFESPVQSLRATIAADEASVNQLVAVAGIETGFTLGDGTVGYEGELPMLGLPISYQVTATPTAAGDSVLLEPAGVEVAAGGASIDVSGVIDRLLGGEPLAVCVADRLPEGVQLDSISVTPGTAVVGLDADGLTLDAASLEQTGSCR